MDLELGGFELSFRRGTEATRDGIQIGFRVDTAGEVAALRSLADGLGRHEGILIYPEGTRFTTAKLERAKQVIAERQPEIAQLAEG